MELYQIKPLEWTDTGGRNWQAKKADTIGGMFVLHPDFEKPTWVLSVYIGESTQSIFECESYNDGLNKANELHTNAMVKYLQSIKVGIIYERETTD